MYTDVKIVETDNGFQLVVDGYTVLDQPTISGRDVLEALIERDVIDCDEDMLDLLDG